MLIWAAVLSLGFIVLIFSNSFKGAWQYDDYANILENSNVQIDSLSPGQLKRSFFRTHPLGEQRIQRPLAYLSFALNHRWGGLHPWGYHLVNLVIHLASAVLLFVFIRALLQTPCLVERYGPKAGWIALVAALLWAGHPIQVTAVTYIVQRMASLAAIFALFALYLFLKARTAVQPARRYGFLGLALLAYLAGLATKENVILVPVCMLVLDLWLLGGLARFSKKKTIGIVAAVTVLIALLVGLVALLGDVDLLSTFPNRPYTPLQRMLTQPRVIWFYLSLIFVPMGSRLTLLHDLEHSIGLTTPMTTLPAFVLLVAVGILLTASLRRYPLTAFCGLFFLVNHLVEASFLNLELIYEHRNYFPSMLLFVPPSAWLIRLIQSDRLRCGLRQCCMVSLVLLVLSNGHTVLGYNKVFKSEMSLWLDVTLKSPRLSLPHNNLGKSLWNAGAFEIANKEFQIAYQLDRFNDQLQKGAVYHNLGLYQAYIIENPEKALRLFENAHHIMNGYPATWYHRARAHLFLGDVDHADEILTRAIGYWPLNRRLIFMTAVLKLVAGKPEEAAELGRRAYAQWPEQIQTQVLLAEIYKRVGRESEAEELLQTYLVQKPEAGPAIEALRVFCGEHQQKQSCLKGLLMILGIEDLSRFQWRHTDGFCDERKGFDRE